MKKSRLLGAVCAFGFIGSANALTIDFESIPTGACLPLTSISTQGFTFTTPAANFFSCNGTRLDLPSNGTISVGSEIPTITTMTQDGGGSFSITSIDLGELFTVTPPGHQVQIEGFFSGGGSASVTFTLDGVNDGIGGLADFETFLLPSSFVNLVSVQLTGTHSAGIDERFMFDNIEVVPIPAAVWLFGSGLLGLVGISRRKKAA